MFVDRAAFARHRRADGGVSSQAFEEETLAGLAERVGMEGAPSMRRADLSDRFCSCATRTVAHRVWSM